MIEFLNFDDIVWLALMQIRQKAAGCPVDCHDMPWHCDREYDDMPEHCREDLKELLIHEKLEMDALDELGVPS